VSQNGHESHLLLSGTSSYCRHGFPLRRQSVASIDYHKSINKILEQFFYSFGSFCNISSHFCFQLTHYRNTAFGCCFYFCDFTINRFAWLASNLHPLTRLRSRSGSHKQSEVFGWSWIPKKHWELEPDTDFLSDSGCPVGHHSPKLGIPVEMVQFRRKLLFKKKFLAVHHDYH